MGKSKKRIFNKNSDNKGVVFKREEIIIKILSDIRNNQLTKETENFISLFGITMEELLEAGALYEELTALKHLFI